MMRDRANSMFLLKLFKRREKRKRLEGEEEETEKRKPFKKSTKIKRSPEKHEEGI